MVEDSSPSPSEQTIGVASAMRRRKKRKWDEPADFLVSTGLATPLPITISNGSTLGFPTPGVFPLSNAITTNMIIPSITPSTATIVQKLCQPKVQDELIAREIVINDAEATIRYKLTKRQTQEEIQRSTGAVVITRGKYRPPNAVLDGEKPLYLHISAGSPLKDMAERIIAVDHAASMVEEILRQGHNPLSTSGPYTTFSNTGQVIQSLSTCVLLGFEPDPSQNIAARIRGPNDQYINHIINETGASVVLRGLGSGNHDVSHAEEAQQLHLYLSSTSPRSLEAARSLAENLLDTISAECGVSRVSSSKVYSAVPPPQQLAGVQTSAIAEVSVKPVVSSSCALPGITQAVQPIASSALVVSSVTTLPTSGAFTQNGNSIPNTGSYACGTANGGTCYSGYGGIYPQATPLQQVALALKQAPVSATSIIASTCSYTNTLPKMTSNLKADTGKRPPQKRKFQELPGASKGMTTLKQNSLQGSECFKAGLKNVVDYSSIPPPQNPSQSRELPPPPPRMPPPPPPKFPSSPPHSDADAKVMLPPPPQLPSSQPPPENSSNLELVSELSNTTAAEPVSDTLLKLVEYEEDEDDVSASTEESCRGNVMRSSGSKPFWAL